MTSAAAIIDELNALGVALLAQGDKLRFHPRSAVPGDLLARLQAHKPELLAMLQPYRTARVSAAATCKNGQ